MAPLTVHTLLAKCFPGHNVRDGDAGTLEHLLARLVPPLEGSKAVVRWDERHRPRLMRACRELGCWLFHLPVLPRGERVPSAPVPSEWVLSSTLCASQTVLRLAAPFVRGWLRDRASPVATSRRVVWNAVLRPLSLESVEWLVYDNTLADLHPLVFGSDRLVDVLPTGWRIFEPLVPDAGVCVLWTLEVGAILVTTATTDGLWLPEHTTNLPADEAPLVDFLEDEWVPTVRDAAEGASCPSSEPVRFPGLPSPLHRSRLRDHLTALHASRDPLVQCALRLNLHRGGDKDDVCRPRADACIPATPPSSCPGSCPPSVMSAAPRR